MVPIADWVHNLRSGQREKFRDYDFHWESGTWATCTAAQSPWPPTRSGNWKAMTKATNRQSIWARSVIGGRRKVAQNSGVAICILHSETRVSFKRTLKTWNTDLNATANSVSSAEIRELEKAAPACFFARLPLVQKQRLLFTFIIELQKSPNKTWCDRTSTPWYGTAIWTGLRYDKTVQRRKAHRQSFVFIN